MSSVLKDFRPMLAAEDTKEVRIEHVCTSESTVEPLPYLVMAQRHADQLQGSDTWVLVSSKTEEACLVLDLVGLLKERLSGKDEDAAQQGVRCTEHIEDLKPGTDCVVVTTVEHVLCRLLAANGSAPKQFKDSMTFMLNMGCGSLTLKTAIGYDRLARFVYDNKNSANRRMCTISTVKRGPFSHDWAGRRQDCRVVVTGEGPGARGFRCAPTEDDPRVAMDDMLERLAKEGNSRAILLMDKSEVRALPRFGAAVEEHCHAISASCRNEDLQCKMMDSSKHAIIDSEESTYLGPLPKLTHVIIYPWREASLWDSATSQVLITYLAPRSKAELRYAACWRGKGRAPEVHYLGTKEEFDGLEDDPIDSTAYTAHFDNFVLSCLDVWPGSSVAQFPLVVGRNPFLVEERLRRLTHKGLLLVDEAKGEKIRPEGLFLFHSFLELSPRGHIASGLIHPCYAKLDSVHAACLLAQLIEIPSAASPAIVDAVCSLTVVLNGSSGITYIDSIIELTDDYKSFDCHKGSLAFGLCHRGPIWLAVCIWHFTVVDQLWRAATDPRFREGSIMSDRVEVNSTTMLLYYEKTFKWEETMESIQLSLNKLGIALDCANREHRLTPRELLEVEEMLVTAFLDKLAFITLPDRGGPFGYSMTSGTELGRPAVRQMRLIDMDKCWEADKEAVGHDTPGIFCIFTYHWKAFDDDGEEVRTPCDLTYVSTAAVMKALGKVDAPVFRGDILSKISVDYQINF